MLSIKLQEQNVQPQQALKPAADGVCQAARVLVQIARDKGNKEYNDYEEIQADIFDCCDRVSGALDKFPDAMRILFSDADRANGWRKLVQATQQIASQTSRLLLVVFGAEHRRLEMAGRMLLESCANAKRFPAMPDTSLQQQAKGLVEGTNKTSSDLMIFNSYVQARAKETEGPKQAQLQRAVGQFNDLNQDLVNNCNNLIKGISTPTKQAFARTVDEIARITREILDMLTPPEDLDIFKVIQDLYNKGNMAVMSQAKPLEQGGGRNVSADDLFREGEEVKRALIPVKGHKNFKEKDDVANNTNVASAKVAKYNNLLADYIANDKIPALKSTLSTCHADMNNANEELVRATNDYLSAVGGDDGLKAPSRAHTTPARNAPNADIARAKPSITEAAKKIVASTSRAVKAGGNKDEFVPAARDTSEATKELTAAIDALADQLPGGERDELKRLCGDVRNNVVATVQHGKTLLSDPSNAAKAKPVQESGTAVARSVKALLDAVNRAGDAGSGSSSGGGARGGGGGVGVEGKSRALNDAAKRIEDIIDKVNDEINPKSKLATHATITGPVSQPELDASAEEVLRRIRELRGYPSKTPKEITSDADALSAVTAKFAKQLEARGKQVPPSLARTLGDLARQIDPPANKAVIDAVNAYVPAPSRSTAQRVDGSADELERLVRATIDAMKPKVEISTTIKPLPSVVTPLHIRDAAEQMKTDNRPVKDYQRMAPQELAQAVGATHADATHLGNLLDKYGGQVAQPALRSQLAADRGALDDAKQDLVRATDALIQSPEDRSRKQDLEAASKRIDDLADQVTRNIIRSVLPTDQLKRGAKPSLASVTNDDLERGGKALIAAENNLAEFRDMTPAELVASANDASGKAATFAAQLTGRGNQVPQAELKRTLGDGARDIDRLNDEQMAAVKDHMEAPQDSRKADKLADVGKRMNDRVQLLLDELLPVAKKDRRNGEHHGNVTPKDIEREGRATQQAVDKVGQHQKLTPKQLVQEAEAAFDRIDKLEKMLEAMEKQPETRAATKAAIQKAVDRLHDESDRLIDKTNDFVRKPEERARAAALEDEISAIKKEIDQIIEDVKPKAAMAQSRGGGGGAISPADLTALGKQVQAGARDVQAYKQQTPQETVAKTEATSGLAAKFADAVLDRAKQDKRPGVADFLKTAAPKVNAANKRMVEATNQYTADPGNVAAQKEVDAATNELINVVQDVLDKLTPSPKQAQSAPNWNKNVTMADIERNAKDLRAAVLEVKKFPTKAPAATSKDSEHASQKLVDFCDDLLVRARKVDNPKHKRVLEESAARLMTRNPQLINATNAYLGHPDDPATGDDLNGVCDLILADLDDIMKQINPKVTVGPGEFRGGKVSPEDLVALGDKVKRKCSVVEQFNQMAPAELAAAANEATRAADDFKEALKARATQVPNAKTKKALTDGAALIARRNDELAAASNAHLADPNDKSKQKELAQACQNMKDAVDEVLGRVRPHATLTDPNSVKVGPVKPADLEVSCEEVIKAATDLQGFRNDSPEETKDKTDDTSRKAAKYAAQVKKLAEQTANPEQKKRLMDAYRDLEDANKGVVASSNSYLGDPESSARQNELHEAAENLKRAARNALDAARPKVDMSGDVRTHNGPVSAQDLREAAEAVKIALRPLKAPEQLSPDQVKDATEDTNKKALNFISLARAKANQTTDPTKKALLNKIVDDINAERSRLGGKANDFLGDNSSTNARALAGSAQALEDLVDKYMDQVKPTAKLTKPTNEKRAIDLESMDAAAEAAKKAVRKLDNGADTMQDDDELVAAADDASSKVARFTEHVQSLMNETQDKELKESLKKALNDLNDDNRDLINTTNGFVKARDPAQRAKLAEACKKTIKDIDRVMGEIREASKPKTFEDEIDEAALDIQEAVDEYAHVPQEIRDLALALAELMRKLAECARNGDRAGIISTSKQIADIIKKIQSFAKPYGEACKDPKLADTVFVGVGAMGNFATQLKILAAVKAAAQGKDPTSEYQIVSCCDGISSALRQTLFGIQSAKLAKPR